MSSNSQFRPLLPSWRFFENYSHPAKLFHRIETNGDWGPWLLCFEMPRRRWYHVFLNPTGNLFLAYNSLVERLTDESSDIVGQVGQGVEQLVSYQLVKNLVSSRISQPSENKRFQFKIQAVLDAPGEQLGDMLVSAVHGTSE